MTIFHDLTSWKCAEAGFAQQFPDSRDILGNRHFCPKIRFETDLVHELNQAANVVADDLAKHFVCHRGRGLASQMVRELPLNHGEHGFRVAPSVVVGQELFLPELEKIPLRNHGVALTVLVNNPHTYKMAEKHEDSSMTKMRSLFEKSGLSLHDLGLKMGYPEETARQSAWQFMKTGDPRISMLRRFAEAMGITVVELVEEKEKLTARDARRVKK